MSMLTTILPSLELNWLSRHDKDLPIPAVIWSPSGTDFHDVRCRGCYYRPLRQEFLVGERFEPFHNGAIIVSGQEPDLIAGTLAHEWRHHWQYFRGMLPDKVTFDMNLFDDPDSYDDAIKMYFESQKHEMDALLFQYRMAPDLSSDHNLGTIRGSR